MLEAIIKWVSRFESMTREEQMAIAGGMFGIACEDLEYWSNQSLLKSQDEYYRTIA